MRQTDMEENEIVRLSLFTDGVCLSSNRELADEELEELLDDELAAEKDLITIGTAIGAYIATHPDLDRTHAIASLLLAIRASIISTNKAMERGDVKVEKSDDINVKEEFDENDYR